MAKAKGTTFEGVVKFLRRNREAATRVLRPGLHGYLDQRISVADWYPEADLVELIHALLQVLPEGSGDPLEGMGRITARHHLDGVYHHLLASQDPMALPRRAFALWASMHDTGKLTATIDGSEALIELAGYGHPSREMCTITGGYILETLVMTGLRDVTGTHVACQLDGAPVCRWKLAWRA